METTHRPARAGSFCTLFLLAFALLIPGQAVAAAGDSVAVSYSLQGCRNNGSVVLPNGSGQFVCADALYTSGNLGKGWNELDLVPFRATLTAGTSAPATQTYLFSLATDNCKAGLGSTSICPDTAIMGAQGFDFISVPVLNTALSSASCAAPVSVTPTNYLVPGIGSVDVSIYRDVTVTQHSNTVCVYDYYARLALGSHLYSGSSLHSYLVNPNGDKTVPLPVNDIVAQSLRKDMSAVADAVVSWSITKNSDQATVSFGDVCAPDAPDSQPASVTVTWTQEPATPSGVKVTANVYAKNPSSRAVTVNVIDVIYQGTAQTTVLDTFPAVPASVNVPANTEALVLTHSVTLPASDGNVGDYLNDVATATYTDPVTGQPIPGTTTATAQAQIATGSVNDVTADISDSESMTGDGLTFSVPAPSVGDFLNGYVADTETTGPVDWEALAQAGSGSITFNKTIYLSPFLVTSGVLSDTAKLDTTSQHLSSNPVNINISSTATVKLTVSKNIPDGYLSQAGDTLKVFFHVSISDPAGYTNDIEIDFANGGPTTKSIDITGLAPDTYTVTETGSQFCDVANHCTTNTLLQPVSNPIPVDLSTPVSGDMTGHCSGTAAFQNTLLAQGIRVEVQKVTAPVLASNDPDYDWSFTLAGPNANNCKVAVVGAGTGFQLFQDNLLGDCLLTDGTYTVTETPKAGWIRDSATPNDGVNTLVCSFTVDAIFDDGKTFSCTFHNTKLAHVSLFKTKSGVADTSTTDQFEFQLREGASLSSVGTIDEDRLANIGDLFSVLFNFALTPGKQYQFCEIVMPGWKTSLTNTFVPNGNDPFADSSVMCVNFTPTAGQNVVFNVDNTPPVNPLSGRTIGFWKNWASCSSSFGKQHPILDQTLAAMDPTGVVLGQYYSLHAGNCQAAVYLLSKTATNGVKKAGDPIFNMVAQMVGVELNIARGDFACGKVVAALSSAQTLLTKYHFVGTGYTGNISKADQVTINNLATEFDNYNNDKPSACL